MVRSILDYSSTIWQCSKSAEILNKVQHKALALCVGLPNTASLAAMELAANVLPLDLWFAEIHVAIRDIAKIQAKSMDKPIMQTLSRCIQSETDGRFITSMSLALTQTKEKQASSGTDIRLIEQEADHEADSLDMVRHFPAYWSWLGSSKSRTYQQAEVSKELVMHMLMEAPEKTTFAFTDGSCLTNTDPCGTSTQPPADSSKYSVTASLQ